MSKSHTLFGFCCGLLTIGSAFAQVNEFQGQTSSGAFYTIAVPENWQGDDGLVIWNHGYQGYTQTEPQANPSLGPLEDEVLAQGYAMAASSFSQTGWAVFNSHIDNQQLYEKFIELVGQPQRILIQGASMGGIVSMRDLEALTTHLLTRRSVVAHGTSRGMPHTARSDPHRARRPNARRRS